MRKNGIAGISNDLSLVTEVVDEIIESVEAMFGPKDIRTVRRSLYEAIINAIEHGNLAISRKEKNEALETGTLDDLLKERPKKEPFASRKTTIEYITNDKKATFIISDEGEGFDWRDIPDPTKGENVTIPQGRGLFIIRSCMDEVSFNEKGNMITLAKHITGNPDQNLRHGNCKEPLTDID